MRLTTLTLLLCFVLAALACASKSGTQSARQTAPHPSPPVSVAGTDDAAPAGAVAKSATCALLSNEEIKAVQGEEPSDAQGSEHLTGSLSMSQCFYRLPTFSKSINLEVTRAAPGAPPDAVADFWRKSFGRAAQEEREQKRGREEQSEREKELERERASGGVREGGHAEEEERGEGDEGPRPQRVAGVGDEAYWSGNPINAALYVLRKDTVIRLSIGGPEDPSVKIKKAKTLAQKVLKHF